LALFEQVAESERMHQPADQWQAAVDQQPLEGVGQPVEIVPASRRAWQN
jgi:hypothetical protein